MRKTAIGKGDDYTTGCLLDYPFLKKISNIITIDLTIDSSNNKFEQTTKTKCWSESNTTN